MFFEHLCDVLHVQSELCDKGVDDPLLLVVQLLHKLQLRWHGVIITKTHAPQDALGGR